MVRGQRSDCPASNRISNHVWLPPENDFNTHDACETKLTALPKWKKTKKCNVTAEIQWLFYFQKASLKYLQFVQKHLKVSRTLHGKFNLKARTWNNIDISSWRKSKRKEAFLTLVPKKNGVTAAERPGGKPRSLAQGVRLLVAAVGECFSRKQQRNKQKANKAMKKGKATKLSTHAKPLWMKVFDLCIQVIFALFGEATTIPLFSLGGQTSSSLRVEIPPKQ